MASKNFTEQIQASMHTVRKCHLGERKSNMLKVNIPAKTNDNSAESCMPVSRSTIQLGHHPGPSPDSKGSFAMQFGAFFQGERWSCTRKPLMH